MPTPVTAVPAITRPPAQAKVKWETDPETGKLLSAVLFGDGEFLVGADFPAGLYQSTGGPGCNWSRRALRPDGSDGAVQENRGGGDQIVLIAATDLVFKSDSCSPWVKIH